VLTPTVVAVLVVVALLAGALTGVAGFGFALLGTAVAAILIDPATAVVLLVLPIFGVNLNLVTELGPDDARECIGRFWPFLAAALVGTTIGMVALDLVPRRPLLGGLGLLTLGFVANRLGALPGVETAADRCFAESTGAMVGLGAGSGLLFGATNVGVQLVSYVRSCDLRPQVFVGVLAMLFLGINGLRVASAAALGLYPSPAFVAVSAGLAVPAVAGSLVGSRIRSRISRVLVQRVVLGLLVVVGGRLLVSGAGIV
jgi:uncharacterized membrane protein YfcA